MKQAKLFPLLIFALLMLASCNKQKKSTENIAAAPIANTPSQSAQFPFPDIPSMLTTPEDRINYLFVHYWDKFAFEDTTLLHNKAITEQGFANQLALISQQPLKETTLKQGIENLCRAMEKQEPARKIFTKLFDNYLFNANSPYFNEQLYLIYLKYMVKSTAIDEAMKSSYQFRVKLIDQNMPGMKANDFIYYTPEGSRKTLGSTATGSNPLILLFYDPECPNCKRTLNEMLADNELATRIARKELTLLAIYTEGEEDIWKRNLHELPQGWLVGNDRHLIQDKALYDLKAMPTLYLLDSQKKVVLKDQSYQTIAQYLGWQAPVIGEGAQPTH